MVEYRLVLVTAPDLEVARHLVRGALERRFAACGKIISNVESHYWWENQLECHPEFQLLFKTHSRCIYPLKAWIQAEHPYDTPEFIVIPVESGLEKYLDWINQETKSKS